MKKFIQHFIISTFLLLFTFPSSIGQEYLTDVQHWSTKEGLLHREISALYEDSTGFIWIGTAMGLNRFDGHTFKHWSPEKDGLNVQNIQEIKPDKSGYLWLFPPWSETRGYENIDLFNPINQKIISFKDYFRDQINFELSGLSSNVVSMENGKIALLSVQNEQVILADKDSRLSYIPLTDHKPKKLITSTTKNTLWIQTETSILEIDLAGSIITTLEDLKCPFVEARPINDQAKYFILADVCTGQFDTYYLMDSNTGKRTKIDNQTFEGFDWAQNFVAPAMIIYSNPVKNWNVLHYTWIYNEDNQLLGRIDDYFTEFNLFPREFLFDRKGRIWIGSNFGLYLFDVHENKFKVALSKEDLNQNQLLPIRGMVTTSERLFVNAENCGTLEIKGTARDVSFVSDPAKEIRSYALAVDPNGNLWSGNLRSFFVYPDKDQSPLEISTPSPVWSFFFLDEERTLIGTEHGLFGYRIGDEQIHQIKNLEPASELSQSTIYHMEFGPDSLLWIASNQGLFKLNLISGEQQKLALDQEGQSFLPGIDFQHFTFESDSICWLATRGQGLIKYHLIKNTYQQFTRNHGLANNSLYAVYPDESGFLWLPSDYGLIRFEKVTGKSWSYLVKDGIPNNEFNRISHAQSEDGVLYFGTIDGLISLNPADFTSLEDPIFSPLTITDFHLYNSQKEVLEDLTNDLLLHKQITLEPHHDFFVLKFALLEYIDADRISYTYQVEGLDKDWIELKGGLLRLGNLPYGNFQLKIKGQTADGQWTNQEIKINLLVTKPFYRKTGFLLLCSIGFISLIVGVFIFQHYRQKKKQAHLEVMVQERTEQIRKDKVLIEKQAEELRSLDEIKNRFFANISHEFRTPLTLIIEPLKQLLTFEKEKRTNDRLKVPLKNSQRLLDLVNQLLDLSKLESGKMQLKLEKTRIDKKLEAIYDSFQIIAKSKNIHLNFEVNTSFQATFWDVAKVERIAYNLLSNAIKYSNSGGIVNFELVQDLANQVVLISCKDNGIGIDKSQLNLIFDRFHQIDDSSTRKNEGTGIGLSLVKELVKLMHGHIEVDSQLGHGTTFSITIPMVLENKVAKFQQSSKLVDDPKVAIINPAHLSVFENSQQRSIKAQNNKRQILIAEDHAELRHFISLNLSRQFDTLLAENGFQALQIAKEHIPDLILSDIMMPEMDGYEFCRSIKEDRLTSHIPVILLTAKASSKNKIEGIKIGADAYISKPFHLEELLVTIDQLIYTRKVLQQKFSSQAYPSKEHKIFSKLDNQFLRQVDDLIFEHISDSHFNVDNLGKALLMSRSQFYRKLKALTDKTPKVYLLESRLNHAMNLIQSRKMTIEQLADQVGFKDARHFSTRFAKHFGIRPSQVAQKTVL